MKTSNQKKNFWSFFEVLRPCRKILPITPKLSNLPFNRKTFEEIDYEKEIYPQLKTEVPKFSKSIKLFADILLPGILAFIVVQGIAAIYALLTLFSNHPIKIEFITQIELMGIFLAIMVITTNKPLNTFTQQMLMSNVLAKVGATLTEGFIGKFLLEQSQMINIKDLTKSDEFLQKSKGYKLNILECFITIPGQKYSQRYLIIALKFDKRSVVSHTVINPVFLSPFTLKTPENFNKINLELEEFNSQYKVYSTDNVEVRVICTLNFMQQMINLEKKFNADKISCAFFNEYAIIALRTKKDFFSIDITDSDETSWEKGYHQIIEDLSSIADIVNHLELLDLYK